MQIRTHHKLYLILAILHFVLLLCPLSAMAQSDLPIQWMYGPVPEVDSVAYSPDGSMLAVGGDGGVQILDGGTAAPIMGFPTNALYYVNSVAFSRNGKTLADGGQNNAGFTPYGVLELWDVTTRSLTTLTTAASVVNAVVYSPDGKTLADCGGTASGGVLELRNASTGNLTGTLPTASTSAVPSIAFSPDGTLLASGGSDGVELWNVATGKIIATLHTAGTYGPNSLAISADGKTLASAGADLELWNLSTLKLITTLASGGPVAFSPDGTILASGGGGVELWSVSTDQPITTLRSAAKQLTALAFSPDGQTLADGGYKPVSTGYYTVTPVLELWNSSNDTLNTTVNTVAGDVDAVALSPNGQILAVGSFYDSVLELWNVSTGKLITTLPTAATYTVSSVAFSPDGTVLADGGFYYDGSGYAHGVIELWNVSTGELSASLNTAADWVSSVAFSPDGKTLANGSNFNSLLELWDVSTGNRIATLPTSADMAVECVAFSPDGKTLASGGESSTSGVLELWNYATGTLLTSLSTAAGRVNTLAFSPDGTVLADGGQNAASIYGPAALELWNVATGKRTTTLSSIAESANSVTFSPDGKVLFVTNEAEVEIFSMASYGLLNAYLNYSQTSGGGVTSLAVSSDGNLLAYGTGNGAIVVTTNPYNAPPPSLTSLSPASTPAGGSSFTLTVTGTGFVDGETIDWNGFALTTTFLSATSMTATVPSSDIAAPGLAGITVANPDGVVSNAVTFTIQALPPSLTALSPNSATVGSGPTTISITGSGFVSGSTAEWNGSSLATAYISATQMTAVVPAGDLAVAGTAGVTVVNPAPGAAASNSAAFAVDNPTPTLAGVSPNIAATDGAATTVTLTGTNFVAGAVARWNGSALSTISVSATQLTAVVPASDLAAPGTAYLTVANPGPGSPTSGAVAFTVSTPKPILAGISPTSATVGTTNLTVTATGSGFVTTSAVQWDGTALATTFVSTASLSFVVPQAKLAAVGAHKVTVNSPAPGGGTSGYVTFAVLPNPAPTLSAISPSVTTVGSAAVTVTATGKNFVPSSVAQWDGVALSTTYGSGASLTFVIPQTRFAGAGAHKITVKSPSPGGGASAALTFTVNNVVPMLTSVSPNSATTGAAATTITLAGQWKSANLTTTFVSSTQLRAVVPTADLATAGTFALTVKNPAPGGGTSGSVTFTVNNPVPALTTISPMTAVVGSAAVTVTATGKGFVKTSTTEWDGAALATTYKSATSLSFIIPKANLAAVGAHSITVSSPGPGGGSSGAVTFIVNNPPPTLKSLSPNSARVGSASQKVTATGTGFLATSLVLWDGAALGTTYVSATSLTVIIPQSDLVVAGAHKVTIKNPTPGGGTSGSVTFTVR